MMKKTRFYSILLNVGAFLISGIFLFPLYWAFLTAFKTPETLLQWPPRFGLSGLTLDNFKSLFGAQDTPIFMWFFNSLFAGVSYASIGVLVSIMAAFALARLEFRFKDTYFKILIGSLAIPGMIMFIPNYTTVDSFGWTDSLSALILPGLGSTFGIFLLRQFFISIPRDIEEAAILDGASILWRVTHIIIPLAKESIIVLWVMNFMANWNDYLWPLVVIFSPEKRTMPVGMATLQGRYVSEFGLVMAGATLIAVPSIIILLLVQKYYIKGVDVSGGLKG